MLGDAVKNRGGREDVDCGPGPDSDTRVPARGQQDPAPQTDAVCCGAQCPRAVKPPTSRLGARKPTRGSERLLADLTAVQAPEPSGQVALIVTGPPIQTPSSERPSRHVNTDAGCGPVLSTLTVWRRRRHTGGLSPHGTAHATTLQGGQRCCGLAPEGWVWGVRKDSP